MTTPDTALAAPLTLAHGRSLANRFVLAPLTNMQSHDDGTLGDDEYAWLTKRAAGGFALVLTCAAMLPPRRRAVAIHPEMPAPRVVVLVPAHNESGHVLPTLASLHSRR